MDVGFGPIAENAGDFYVVAVLLSRNMGKTGCRGMLPTLTSAIQWAMARAAQPVL
jgi:hypothetical protein